MDLKTFIFAVVPPIFLVGFVLFSRYVAGRLTSERLRGWQTFSLGGLTAVAGLFVASYIGSIRVGSAMVLLGVVIGAFGLARFFAGK